MDTFSPLTHIFLMVGKGLVAGGLLAILVYMLTSLSNFIFHRTHTAIGFQLMVDYLTWKHLTTTYLVAISLFYTIGLFLSLVGI